MKKLLFVIAFSLAAFIMSSDEYYICLGSFVNRLNYERYIDELKDSGLTIFTEEAIVSDQKFIRVMYEEPFTSRESAREFAQKLSNNPVIQKYGIRDLWVKPIKQFETNAKFSSVKKENATATNTTPQKTSITNKTITNKTIDNNFDAFYPREEWTIVDDNQFKRVHKDGYSNIIFSNRNFESLAPTQVSNNFSSPDYIYGLAYLSGPIGIVNENDIWFEVSINGRKLGRVVVAGGPSPEWDRLHLMITSSYEETFKSLPKGDHRIEVVYIKNINGGNRPVTYLNEYNDIITEMQPLIVPTKISYGHFIYAVTE